MQAVVTTASFIQMKSFKLTMLMWVPEILNQLQSVSNIWEEKK